MIAGIFLHIVLNMRYQPASCTIIRATLETTYHEGKSGENDTYELDFTYHVNTHDGNQVEATGPVPTYDGPKDSDFSDYGMANRVLSRYQPGHTYQCWYAPDAHLAPVLGFNPSGSCEKYWFCFPGAVLVFNPYGFWDNFWFCCWTLIVSLSGFMLVALCIRNAVHVHLLRQRGVTEEGTVSRHELRTTRGRSYTVSRIVYHVPDRTQTIYQVKKRGSLPIGSSYAVTYDPLNPKINARAGERPEGCLIIGFLIGALSLVCLSMLVILAAWLA